MITISQDELDKLLREVVEAFDKMVDARLAYFDTPAARNNVHAFDSASDYNHWRSDFDEAAKRKQDAKQNFCDLRAAFYGAGIELSHFIPASKWFKCKDRAVAIFIRNSGNYAMVKDDWAEVSKHAPTDQDATETEKLCQI